MSKDLIIKILDKLEIDLIKIKTLKDIMIKKGHKTNRYDEKISLYQFAFNDLNKLLLNSNYNINVEIIRKILDDWEENILLTSMCKQTLNSM